MQHLRELRRVAEADTLEMDPAIDPGEVGRVGRIHHLRFFVEDADDLVERGDGGEEGVVELRELLDRVEEVREVQREREQGAGGHVAVVDEPAAVAEHDRDRDRREQVDRGEVDPVEDDGAVVRGAVALVHAPERALLLGLARERLDDAHPGDVLGERRGDERKPLPHIAIGAVRPAAEPRGDEPHRWEHGQRGEREAPVEEEEHHGRADQQQRVLDEARDPVGDELVERLDVVRDAADDHARPVPLVVAHREPLEMAEQPVPQVGEHPLADPAGEVGVRRGEHERGDRGDEEEHHELVEP